jgi:hypothetical protein
MKAGRATSPERRAPWTNLSPGRRRTSGLVARRDEDDDVIFLWTGEPVAIVDDGSVFLVGARVPPRGRRPSRHCKTRSLSGAGGLDP